MDAESADFVGLLGNPASYRRSLGPRAPRMDFIKYTQISN